MKNWNDLQIILNDRMMYSALAENEGVLVSIEKKLSKVENENKIMAFGIFKKKVVFGIIWTVWSCNGFNWSKNVEIRSPPPPKKKSILK